MAEKGQCTVSAVLDPFKCVLHTDLALESTSEASALGGPALAAHAGHGRKPCIFTRLAALESLEPFHALGIPKPYPPVHVSCQF